MPRVATAAVLIGALALSPAAMAAQTGWQDSLRAWFGGQMGTDLSETRVAAGLRQALQVGAESAVAQLGQRGGFWQSEAMRIPLPSSLEQVEGLLRDAGFGPQLKQFQLTLNRAAEAASAEVGSIFRDVIAAITLEDAYAILRGPENAASAYLQDHSQQRLRARIGPIVREATAATGVTSAYKDVVSRAGPLAALAGFHLDLDSYVTDYALDRLFAVIAREEAAIRAHPAARTSALLREVFGS